MMSKHPIHEPAFEEHIASLTNRALKNSVNQKQSQKMTQYLQNWTHKLKRDGHPIERVLQIIYNNCLGSTADREWLDRFLTSCKNSLKKRNLKPRVCLPIMHVDLLECEVRDMLRKQYQHLRGNSNEKLLEYVMSSGYTWRGMQTWQRICEQMSRNGYEVSYIERERVIKSGVVIRNNAMKLHQAYYGECLYLMGYEGERRGQNRKMHCVIAMGLNEFGAGVVFGVGVFQGENSSDEEHHNRHRDKMMNKIIETMVNWNPCVLPAQVIVYHNSCPDGNNGSEQQIMKIGSSNIPVTLSSDPHSKQHGLPHAYFGLWSPSKPESPQSQLHSLLHKSLQYSMESIIENAPDICKLITILLKIQKAINSESLFNIQSSSQYLSFSQQKSHLKRIKYYKGIICCKFVLTVLLDLMRRSQECRIVEEEAIEENGVKYKIEYRVEYGHWECECGLLYRLGLPCSHIIKIVEHYEGSIEYYINQRWKKGAPVSASNKKEKQNYSRGLMRLVSLYKTPVQAAN